jgi:hypothetical protein
MLLKIACPCGHTDIVSAETLPRMLTCSSCSSSRHVEVRDGRRMASVDVAGGLAIETDSAGHLIRPKTS